MFQDKIKKINRSTKVLLLASIALLGSIYFLVFTATGLTWTLNSYLEDPSAIISISSTSGRFDGSTTIKGLKYQSDSVDINFASITMEWSPFSLFGDQIAIDKLRGEQLTVNFKNKNTNGKALKLGFPKATHVLTASIQGLKVSAEGKTIYIIESTEIDNIYLERDFFADKIVLRSPDEQWLKISGSFGFSSDSVINLTTESSFPLLSSKKATINAKGTLVGNAAQLRFLQQVSTPFSANISGRIKHLFTNPSWILDTELNSVDLSLISNGQFFKNLYGTISLQGNWKQFQVYSSLKIVDSAENTWLASIEGQSSNSELNFKADFNAKSKHKSSKISKAHFKGSYNLESLIDVTPVFGGLKLAGEWSNLSLNLNQHTVLTKSGHIDFDGRNYRSNLEAEGIKFNTLGPVLTRLEFKTHRQGNGNVNFRANTTTVDGSLKFSGSMVERNNSFELDNLFLNGKNFAIVRKPEAHVIVSPTLSFVRVNDVMTSTGTITIPTANIQLQEFKKTLATLCGLIYPGNETLKSTGFVDVKFGKSVWMHGYGLNAHVTGEVSLLDLSSKQLLAHGELNVLRGKYHKFRKNLSVSSGVLKFNNQNLDDPELRLTVMQSEGRNRITGRLQELFNHANKKAETGNNASQSEGKLDSRRNVAYNNLRQM